MDVTKYDVSVLILYRHHVSMMCFLMQSCVIVQTRLRMNIERDLK